VTSQLLDDLADYAVSNAPLEDAARRTACLCLTDALACAVGAAEQKPPLLGSLFGDVGVGTTRVLGTALAADPVKAAFDTSMLIRWMDFSDTSVLGGHPSDNIGAILSAAQHRSERRLLEGSRALTMDDVARALRTAYEIQGCLASNKVDGADVGLDHVFYVKLASTAVATVLLGGTRQQVRNALSNAVLDGQSLNAYRHAPNAGSRKGWAGADASSRGLLLAAMSMRGEMGYPDPIGVPLWGFEAVHLHGRRLELGRAPAGYFLDNVIFKLVPCQRNGSTAVEAALRLHGWFCEHGGAAERIEIETQDEAMRRIVTSGPLPNPAARDHCLQYMVAVSLLHGRLVISSYTDEVAADPRIDALRQQVMVVTENPGFTAAHHDPTQRSCASAIRIFARDGAVSERVEVAYPIGDPRRRHEATSLLQAKFRDLTAPCWDAGRQDALLTLLSDPDRLLSMHVPDFMDAVTDTSSRLPGQ
jgi:2-methylcitrate dehydratase